MIDVKVVGDSWNHRVVANQANSPPPFNDNPGRGPY